MSYGLRGCNGRLHGLGVFNPSDQPAYEDCDPRDTPCVMRNAAKSDAYVLAMAGAQAQNNLDQCLANAENATSPEQKAQAVASCGAAYSDAGAYAAQTAATPVTWYSGGGSPIPFEGNQQATAALAAKRATMAPAVRAASAPAAPEGAPALSSSLTVPTVGGFDLSSIPWYIWVGGAVAAFLAFGKGGGR